ncbi:MAG: hypothetical protein NWS16_04865, partial [Akkermansiaceae bacterium]|nr:hypothetical protein [Akkermansiaceae bacterium]
HAGTVGRGSGDFEGKKRGYRHKERGRSRAPTEDMEISTLEAPAVLPTEKRGGVIGSAALGWDDFHEGKGGVFVKRGKL